MARLSRFGVTVGLLVALPAAAQPVHAQPVDDAPVTVRFASEPASITVDPGAPSSSASAPLTTADPVGRWHSFIAEAAERFGVPARWIARVMRVESGGATRLGGAPITSRAGAMGLMQLMPDTWAALRAAYGLGADPYDPHDNIIAGAAYLRALYDRFGYPGLFGAYNAGPGRYGAYLVGVRALPDETRRYLEVITATPDTPPGRARPLAARALFARRDPAPGASQRAPTMPCDDALFVVQNGQTCAR